MYEVPEGTTTFTIGRIPFQDLAVQMELGGMSRADAQEGAFDYMLNKAGGNIVRVGEVFVPVTGDTQGFVEALCVGAVHA